MNHAHATICPAIVAPQLCGGVDIAVREVGVVGAVADGRGDSGAGELVGAENGAGVAEGVATEAGDES